MAPTVKYECAPDVIKAGTSVGGRLIEVEKDASYETADPAEIAALDEHPGLRRADEAGGQPGAKKRSDA